MITVQETTDWSNSNAVNHRYILSNDRKWLYGIVANGQILPKILNRPIQFDARGRTFTVLLKTHD